MLQIKACGLSDVGLARAHNEDCFGIDSEHRLAVVADGMGGHSHGEVASRIAVQSIRSYVDEHLGNHHSRPPEETGECRHAELLETAVRDAHQKVLGAIREDGALYGMGTTVVGFLLCGTTAAVANVGDSRVYRIREGRLELLTQDHTWVNEQVVAGFLSAEQARVHPLKNVITRALGGDNEIKIDMLEVTTQPGDLYLLCSDGLTTMLSDPEIQSALEDRRGLEPTCRLLVDEANARGGLDNVTVVLVEIEESVDDADASEARTAEVVTVDD
ncbi:MAG: Stp1/IreP family PP2C-type Ser/Thr phosphatase [Acidobacteriota bacterium]|nr:Stp1/IreP family PP2C-type Ser/Thr phosphatase [Acidobacteriota bacterium]